MSRPLEDSLNNMVALTTNSENQDTLVPGAVMEWQAGAGRTFRFVVGEEGLVLGSAPGADIRLGQKDPPILAALRFCPGYKGEESYLHCRVLAPHCPLMINGRSGETLTKLKARDRFEIAGHVGLVIQIPESTISRLSERVGTPELAEYAKALEAHAALVDQWHKSLDERQKDLEKREIELQQVVQELIHKGAAGTTAGLSSDPADRNSREGSSLGQIITETPPSDQRLVHDGHGPSIALEATESSIESGWDEGGDSWDFLTHPETESTTTPIETSSQYWPAADETESFESPGEVVEPSGIIDGASPDKQLDTNTETIPVVFHVPQNGEREKPPPEYPLDIPERAKTEPQDHPENIFSDTVILGENPPDAAGPKPAQAMISSKTIEDPDSAVPSGNLYPTFTPNIFDSKCGNSSENEPPEVVTPGGETLKDPEDSQKTLIPDLVDTNSMGVTGSGGDPSHPESWTVPLGDFFCPGEPPENSPIAAVHISGAPKVFLESISQGDPVGGQPAWEHENLPRDLGIQQIHDRDFRVWEIPRGAGLNALELPPVLGIWYRIILQVVLGVRALHSAGRSLGGPNQQTGLDWAILEPAGLVKIMGPGNRGNNQAADLKRVGHLAQDLWDKAFGKNSPQPEFIKDLFERFNGPNGANPPIENLEQLAVELDRVGLRIRANPYAWAALLQKTFPGWTSNPSKRISA